MAPVFTWGDLFGKGCPMLQILGQSFHPPQEGNYIDGAFERSRILRKKSKHRKTTRTHHEEEDEESERPYTVLLWLTLAYRGRSFAPAGQATLKS